MPDPVIILGLGFTTQHLARRLRERDIPVYAAVRAPERFAEFQRLGVHLSPLRAADLPQRAVLIHSIPPLAEPDKSQIRALVCAAEPRRIVYISSTGVYGAQTEVSENSQAIPDDEKGLARMDEEGWISGKAATQGSTGPTRPWSSLILRSAAIYGPGRGIHVRVREGKLPRGAGGVVSRIHVDDLAALLDAGIVSELEGAWPVADDLPVASAEVAEWCAKLMAISVPGEDAPVFPVAGRHVDGKKIRELLGIELRYPTYCTGIPASLSVESRARLGESRA